MPPLTNRLRAYPIRQVVQPLGSIADNIFHIVEILNFINSYIKGNI